MFPKSKMESTVLAFVFTLVFVGLYLARTDLLYFEGVYVREDSYIEWLTFMALFFGGIASFYRIIILKPFRTTSFIIGLLLTGLFFWFGAGEEISWGQRVFGFKSPEFFMQYNAQYEFNLHNLKFGNFKVNKIIFGSILSLCVICYFFILPYLYRKYDKFKELVNNWAIPLPQYYHIFLYVLLFVTCVFIKKSPSGKSGEILEFGGTWICLLMILNPLNRPIFSRKSIDR